MAVVAVLERCVWEGLWHGGGGGCGRAYVWEWPCHGCDGGGISLPLFNVSIYIDTYTSLHCVDYALGAV
eukprot:249867-Chlamydomonas_euryale.AAC.1